MQWWRYQHLENSDARCERGCGAEKKQQTAPLVPAGPAPFSQMVKMRKSGKLKRSGREEAHPGRGEQSWSHI